jgi:hypothetical protein
MKPDETAPEGSMLNVEISDEVAEGIYSNLAIISHTPAEFIVDFIQVFPGVPKARVRSRIILSPSHFKRLVIAMQDNLQKYESRLGEIVIQDDGYPPVVFGGPGLA